MAVNLINGSDTTITKTNDDITVDFSSTRSQQISEMSNNITLLQNSLLTKLWENENPTTSFSPQTISFNATNYDYFIVIYKNTYNGTLYNSKMIIKNVRFSLDGVNAGTIYVRNTDTNGITNAGVAFQNGLTVSTYGTETTDNEKAIPYQIYGGKLGD